MRKDSVSDYWLAASPPLLRRYAQSHMMGRGKDPAQAVRIGGLLSHLCDARFKSKYEWVS